MRTSLTAAIVNNPARGRRIRQPRHSNARRTWRRAGAGQPEQSASLSGSDEKSDDSVLERHAEDEVPRQLGTAQLSERMEDCQQLVNAVYMQISHESRGSEIVSGAVNVTLAGFEGGFAALKIDGADFGGKAAKISTKPR